MSYIHEALKKAQGEKDVLASRYAKLWSEYRQKSRILSREWLVSGGLVLVAIILSAYSWLYAMNQRGLARVSTAPFTSGQSASGPERTPQVQPRVTQRVPPSYKTVSPTPPTSPPAMAAKEAPPERVVAPPATTAPPSGRKEPEKAPEREPARPPAPTATPRSQDGETLYARAFDLQKKGRVEEAKELYESALAQSPRLISALNNLGAIYLQEKDYSGARKMFEQAILVDPGYADAYYNLACLHALQQQVDRSLFYLKKAVSVNAEVRNWAKTDKDLQNLRGNPEYEKIVKGE